MIQKINWCISINLHITHAISTNSMILRLPIFHRKYVKTIRSTKPFFFFCHLYLFWSNACATHHKDEKMFWIVNWPYLCSHAYRKLAKLVSVLQLLLPFNIDTAIFSIESVIKTYQVLSLILMNWCNLVCLLNTVLFFCFG